MTLETLEALELEGRGKVRAARIEDALAVRVDDLTTQTRRFKSLIREFFRTEFRSARPKFGATKSRF